jgi:phenylacetate-coenzyme A ligase PaaK-like adenylate-forming protein
LQGFEDRIFSIDDASFEALALEVFQYQYAQVDVYRTFCDSLRRTPATVKQLENIPFLPVEFFKNKEIITRGKKARTVFESSGTTGSVPSKHYVADTNLYERSFLTAFKQFYGEPGDCVILALLPSYLERGNSSLVYMADKLIRLTGSKRSGFFLNEFEKLHQLLLELKEQKQKTILLGVTYALLDFAAVHSLQFPELIIMETGGMKGRREELTRGEVHQILQQAFGVPNVHSEYGMTELLSQGYSKGKGIFETPAWMKVVVRDLYDPLKLIGGNATGGVNVIDLANIESCSFIATGDMGRLYPNGSFEILGRANNAEIRGCNLMVAENDML